MGEKATELDVVRTGAPVHRSGPNHPIGNDVVGIGALNLDYIVDISPPDRIGGEIPLADRLRALFAERGMDFVWGTEADVDADTVYAALEEINAASVDAALGGSAYNAVLALSHMQLDITIGYVGISGRIPMLGLSSRQVFGELGIDHRYVHHADQHLAGICLSLIDAGDRTLFTHAGANADMAGYLRGHREALVDYLAASRVIHLTSFLDDATPTELLRLLHAVRERNPDVILSFDPGHVWATGSHPAVDGLLAMSTYLLLNHHEFTALGRPTSGDTDHTDHTGDTGDTGDTNHTVDTDPVLAARILDRLDDPRATVVVKRPGGILLFRREDGGVRAQRLPQTPLAADQITDSTGAGDAFAAGILAAVASDRLRIEFGSVLGMHLARHKLRHIGTSGHREFAEITRRIVIDTGAGDPADERPKGVFIGHGHDLQWLAVKELIEAECGLPAQAFDSGAWSGREVTEALRRYLEQCSFAVCVLTVEDVTGDHHEWARQNVVHEVGLFQGRYGPNRVALLVEEGCSFVPAAPPDRVIRFPRGAVSATFWDVRAIIRAEFPAVAQW